MSKLFFIVAIVVAGALFLGGVVEIKIHPENLASVPGTLLSYGQKFGVTEKAMSYFETAKTSLFSFVLDRYTKKSVQQTGEVAGSQDKLTDTPEPSETIPLKF